jgi:predicted aspartyl protease
MAMGEGDDRTGLGRFRQGLGRISGLSGFTERKAFLNLNGSAFSDGIYAQHQRRKGLRCYDPHAVGEVRASVVLENGDDRTLARLGTLGPGEVRRVDADVLVDTGAVLVLLPQDMVEALGLGAMDKAVVTLTNDQKVEMAIAGPLVLTALGRTMNTDCLVGPPRCEPLLGQVVLERLDLVVDSVNHRLTVRPESPFLPSLKAK